MSLSRTLVIADDFRCGRIQFNPSSTTFDDFKGENGVDEQETSIFHEKSM